MSPRSGTPDKLLGREDASMSSFASQSIEGGGLHTVGASECDQTRIGLLMQMAHDRPLKPDSKSCKKGELPEIMFYLLIPSDNQAGEHVRLSYENKCVQLRTQDANDVDPFTIERIRAAIRDLRTKLNISAAFIDNVSRRVVAVCDDSSECTYFYEAHSR